VDFMSPANLDDLNFLVTFSRIIECKKGVHFDGSNTTNRILDVLEEKRPKIICIDELDKMHSQFQENLLNFMERGHIKVDLIRKQYDTYAKRNRKV
jgi:hypothetical protein